MKKVLVGAAITAAFGFAPLGANAVTATFAPAGSVVAGNDCAGVLGQPFAACEYNGSAVIAKWEVTGTEGSYAFEGAASAEINSGTFPGVTAGQFSFTIDAATGASGTFSYTGPVGITAFVLKAGNDFRVFELTNPQAGLDWLNIAWNTATAGLVNRSGKPLALSHITFYDGLGLPPNEIPIPAAAWLLGSGLLAMGAIGRRRMSARV